MPEAERDQGPSFYSAPESRASTEQSAVLIPGPYCHSKKTCIKILSPVDEVHAYISNTTWTALHVLHPGNVTLSSRGDPAAASLLPPQQQASSAIFFKTPCCRALQFPSPVLFFTDFGHLLLTIRCGWGLEVKYKDAGTWSRCQMSLSSCLVLHIF